jgi:hypothetical protein
MEAKLLGCSHLMKLSASKGTRVSYVLVTQRVVAMMQRWL